MAPGCRDCREYVDRLLLELDKRLHVQATADERALAIAAEAIKNHFIVVNNFQARIERMEATFITGKQLFGYLVAIGGLLIGLATYLIVHPS
jgi:mannitol/fructose-specific phosphotransferase system IIA component (Ntr-type)